MEAYEYLHTINLSTGKSGELYPFILAGRPHSKPPWRIGLSVGVLHKTAKTPDEYDANISECFGIKK